MPQFIAPTSVGGFGVLSVSTSSLAISSCTAGPGSDSYPTGKPLPNGSVTLWNSIDSANNVNVAPLGGTAVAATCVPIAPGQAWTFSVGDSTTSPTVISSGSATLFVIW